MTDLRRVCWAALAVLGVAARVSAQVTPCSTDRRPARELRLFIEAAKPAVKDSILTTHLCLVPPAAGVGSYAATIAFDYTMLRAVRVEAADGMQVTNATTPGVVRVAGVSPRGFASGRLATITFARIRGKAWSNIDLTLSEASSPSGTTLLELARVRGFALGAATAAAPRIDSIIPRTTTLDHEGVTDLVLFGRGFGATGITVLFGGASIDSVGSEAHGSVIRFVAPTIIPARGDVPAHRIQPGTVNIRVRTPSGTSNAVTLLIRGEGS